MQYLSDMGAEITKIEPPQGAFERHWGGADRTKVGGVSAFFLCANRNARSIALDLKKPEARDVVLRLIDKSHAVAENFRPGALERLSLGYDDVHLRKPDIIYVPLRNAHRMIARGFERLGQGVLNSTRAQPRGARSSLDEHETWRLH